MIDRPRKRAAVGEQAGNSMPVNFIGLALLWVTIAVDIAEPVTLDPALAVHWQSSCPCASVAMRHSALGHVSFDVLSDSCLGLVVFSFKPSNSSVHSRSLECRIGLDYARLCLHRQRLMHCCNCYCNPLHFRTKHALVALTIRPVPNNNACSLACCHCHVVLIFLVLRVASVSFAPCLPEALGLSSWTRKASPLGTAKTRSGPAQDQLRARSDILTVGVAQDWLRTRSKPAQDCSKPAPNRLP